MQDLNLFKQIFDVEAQQRACFTRENRDWIELPALCLNRFETRLQFCFLLFSASQYLRLV